MVPVLAFIFAAKGFAPAHVVHLALGTAMATILFTSVSSVRAHHRHGAVNWSIVRRMAPGIVIGTFGGALLASVLDLRLLTIVFTAADLLPVGADAVRAQAATRRHRCRPPPA